MKLLITAAIALGLSATSAVAIPTPVMKVTGATFYTRCVNPPPDRGQQVVAMCAAYVAGIADEAEDENLICLDPSVTPVDLLPFSLNWIKAHMQNGNYPAAVQIRTGLVRSFPCARVGQVVQRRQPMHINPAALSEAFKEIWPIVGPDLLKLMLH